VPFRTLKNVTDVKLKMYLRRVATFVDESRIILLLIGYTCIIRRVSNRPGIPVRGETGARVSPRPV